MEALAEIAQVILNYANSQSSTDRIQKKKKKSKHSWMKRFQGNQEARRHQRSDYASLRLGRRRNRRNSHQASTVGRPHF